MDSYEYSVVILDLNAGSGEEGHITNSPDEFAYAENLYLPSPELEIDPQPLTGDFSNGEYVVKGLVASLPLVSGLSQNLPYSKVSAVVRELFYDGDGVLTGTQYLFRGYVYQCNYKQSLNRVDIVLKDHKYYTDTTAGIPCTELCSVAYFGDSICKKTAYSETHTVDSVSGYALTIVGPLITSTNFLFRNGYIENGAQRIKIKYHEAGLVFQMARPVPASWAGAVVEVFAGCDKTLLTCRNIHNNEERFLGLGIAMIDYNPLYETA